MTFPIYRFRSITNSVITAAIILLSFQAKVVLACETPHKSAKALSAHSQKVPPVILAKVLRVRSKKTLPFYDVAVKRIWIKKHTPLKKTKRINNEIIHAKIKRVITDYKTGLNEIKKDQISQHILKQSKKYGYDPLFLTALIITESSFNHRAKSKAGALGLMQIRLRTGKAMASEANIRWRGKRTLYRPGKNIALGSYYLSKMFNRFGDMKTALEAYNHGPTRTARYLRRGKKTKKYSGKVFAIYDRIRLAKVES